MSDDDEIIAEFLVESHENLDQLDRDLVELERDPRSRELLSSIFRTIHTIKGTSGFLAMQRLEALTHVGENLLSRLRDGELTMSPAYGDVLLRMVDTVRELLDLVERTGSDVGDNVDVDSVVAALRAALEGDVPVATAAAVSAATGSTEPTPVAPAPLAASPEAGDLDSSQALQAHPQTHAETATDGPGEAVVAATAIAAAEVVVEAEDIAASVTQANAGAEESAPGLERRSVADSSVRVDIELLDTLVQLVGELVLTRNQILQQTGITRDLELTRTAQRLDLIASELQESVMKTRMQPMGQVWSKMPRIVRDLSNQLGREVELRMDGHETELDRSLLEALKGPLTHLVRNSMDHGIELPADRVAVGKPSKGTLSLRAFHESGQVVIEIADDGKGVDPERVAEVALKRGVVTREQLNRMETREIVNLIFRPGFSTAEQVTNVSGRGVGMDVVRTNIESIGGSVDVTSQVGVGTTVRVRIPLTLAIIPALVVGEGGERYAIPQANLVELVRIEDKERIEVLSGAPVLRLRGKLLPLVSLSDALGGEAREADAFNVVVLQSDDVRFGLVVDEIHDTQEIVVKPIGRQLKELSMYAGATIMGDGRVSLILDVAGLAASQSLVDTVDDSDTRASSDETTQLLIMEIAAGRRAALPLQSVSRLEEFPKEQVERAGRNEVVQYRDGILPLVRLANVIGLPDTAGEQENVSVIVHEHEGNLVGIVIDRVLDVVDTAVIKSDVGERAGVLGSAVVQDKVTDLVDLDAIVALSGVGA